MSNKDKEIIKINNNNNIDEIESVSLSISKKIVPEWKKLKLKAKDIKFLTHYINNGFNQTDAYIKAFPGKDLKRNVARVMGHRLLTKVNVKRAFLLWKTEYIEATKPMLEPALLNQLKKRAFYDVTKFFNDNGKMKKLSEIDEEWRCCIDGIERKFYGKDADVSVVVLKLADKDKSMDRLEKYINMIEEKGNDINLNISGETKINLLNVLHGKKE
jgi:hypothetical protein